VWVEGGFQAVHESEVGAAPNMDALLDGTRSEEKRGASTGH